MDQLINIAGLNLPIFNEFCKNVLISSEYSNIFMFHPEYYLILKDQIINFYDSYLSSIYVSNLNLVIDESYLSPILLIPHLLFIYFGVAFFLLIYFSYFNNPNSEDNIVDHDYLAFNLTIEAEEEIGSMDDMILSSVILLYIFL